jgi:hypothetical protein
MRQGCEPLIDHRDHAGVKAERTQQLFPHTIAAPGREHRQRDTERAIRWLIALMMLCCDPLAITLMAVSSARRSTVQV